MRHVLLLGLTICFATTLLFGQQQTEKVKAIKVANTTAVYLGKVKPTTEKYKFTSLDKRNDARRNKQLPPNFIGRGKSKVTRPELEHQGPDPLRQTKFSNRFRTIIEPLVNVDGLSNSFGSPHDPSGSIGVNNYMQAINATVIGIFDKSGSQLAEFAANSLWEPLGENGIGDPIILFDHETSQWIITEFAQPALLLFAVSETSDPAGDYNVYSFATPTFPDYPKYGIWTDHVVVTSNESGPGALHQYFIDREALMSGSSDVTIQRVEIAGNTSTEAGFYVTTPVQWNGSTLPGDDKPIALKINDSSWGEVSEDALEVFTFDIDLDNPDNTVVEKTTLTTAPFDSYPCDRESGGFACVSQGGDGSGGLDAIPEVVMNIPHYRNFGTHESIVLNFITDVTDGNNLSGIRWMELRRVDGSDWSIYQEGTFAPDDGLHRFMGSIGMDASGNIGLAYNVSSPSEFAGIRFTGRFADDPLGEMTVEEYTVISGINPINTDRFGDYPHITIDPVDGQTFWFTAEYAGNGSNNSKTRLLAFQLEKKDNDIAVSEISSPNTGGGLTDAETVTASILNNGNLAATGFDIQLVVDGNEIEVFTYEATLDAGATYEHTFSSAVDLSALGDYEIQVSVLYDVDELPGNNSTSKTVTNLPQLNGAISLELETETCNSSFTGIAVLQNQGADEITGAELELFVNGNSSSLVTFEGAIETGRNATIEVVFEDLSSGQNTLSVVINTLNGESDEIASNNSAEGAVNFNADLEQVTLTLLTDEYPGETTWQITNESEEVVLTGGPYEAISTTFVENICLPSDQCYVFTIFDAAGDGICCGFGEGSFSLSDSQGEVIFESDGNFGASQDALICLGDGEFDELDASVSFISDLSEVCLVDFPTSFQIKNEGTENLTSLTVDLNVNGALQETIEWTGDLAFGQIEEIDISLNGLDFGANSVEIASSNPNGMTDVDNSNDTESISVDYRDDLLSVKVEIQTDGFPGETAWGIFDANEDLVATGGPFSVENALESEQVCLVGESCYTFVIVDTFGDGITGGSYSVTDAFGTELVSGNGAFDDRAEVEFCTEAADQCKLAVEINVEDVQGSSTGLIQVIASGAEDIRYSIDGGQTFQSIGTFRELEAGTYDVVVFMNPGCTYEETVTISRVLGIEDKSVSIFPNPTEGLFQVRFNSKSSKNEFLHVELTDMNGKVIQKRKLSRYNGEFIGSISLVSYPKGVYIMRLTTSKESIITKVIKE